jgi:hypothetical protein
MNDTQRIWLITLSVDGGILIFPPVQTQHLAPGAALLVVWISLVVMQLVILLSLHNKVKKLGKVIPISVYWKASGVALLTGIISSFITLAARTKTGG